MAEYRIVPGGVKVRVDSGPFIFSECNRQRIRIETPYERTKRQVYATGNKWAIENFHATHD